MKKVMHCLLILIVGFLMGFSYNPVNVKNQISQKNSINKKWESIDRLHYVQGKIVLLKKSLDGKYLLRLKIEKDYHTGTDPIDNQNYPFKIGSVIDFYLKDQPKFNFSKNKRIIIYESDVTTNGHDRFLGASIKYYEKNGKFFDLADKQINLPSTQYPNTL